MSYRPNTSYLLFFTERLGLYAEGYFGRGEDGDRGDDEVEREDIKAESVDDHRRELPVIGLLGVVVLVLDLACDEA